MFVVSRLVLGRILAGLSVSLICLLPLCAFGQLDTIHYFPPVHEAYPTANQGALYVSTPSVSPVNFTLTDGGGAVLASGTVSNANYYKYQMNGVNADVFLSAADLNTPLSNRGLILHASAPVYANLRYVAVNHNQSFSITSKGRRSFGTSFRIAHAKADAASASNSVVSVMATENNTQVTIDLSGTNLILLGPSPPSTASPLTFTLNQGQCVGIAIKNSTNGANRNNMIGRLITANRPVVTVMGNYLGCFASGNHDIGLDQPVAENLLGNNFAFLQGVGAAAKEKVIIVANQNGTDVFVNGNALPVATLNAGGHIEIAGTNYTADSVMYVQTSQPAYAWQVLFGADVYANWGLNFVPPVSCLTERFVDFIPAIDSVGTRRFSGNLNIITYSGSTLLVNGSPPAGAPVAIPGSNLVAYRLHGLTGGVSVSSNTIAVVGFYGANGPSSYAGYFSGFDSIPEIFASVTDSVCPDTLFVRGGFDSYQWLYNGSPIPAATDTFHFLNGNTGYYNVIVSKGSCVDSSGTFTIACVLPALLEHFEASCLDDSAIQFDWKTLSETKVSSYAIDASSDGEQWRVVGQVPSQRQSSGAASYSLKIGPGSRQNVFRLRMIDEDGRTAVLRSTYSPCPAQIAELWVQPHPVRGSTQLYFRGFDHEIDLSIHDLSGKLVVEKRIFPGSADEISNLEFKLPTGLYFVRANSGRKQVSRKVLVL